jgi:flagella basal body P-ring formation protein FlgA
VSATAVALSDADVGEVTTFRVVKTRKVLKGLVESSRRARVVIR